MEKKTILIEKDKAEELIEILAKHYDVKYLTSDNKSYAVIEISENEFNKISSDIQYIKYLKYLYVDDR